MSHITVSVAPMSRYLGYVTCFDERAMETVPALQDITFACAHCASPLVVDIAAAGLTLPCQQCGAQTMVPNVPVAARNTEKAEGHLAELRRQLKENESQRTEITGYINQLTIQLHRWQLRMQTLDERKRDLDKQIEAPVNNR
jgi:transcription elongation factor Elf1